MPMANKIAYWSIVNMTTWNETPRTQSKIQPPANWLIPAVMPAQANQTAR